MNEEAPIQLSAQKIEMQGLGALQAAYRQLAERLRSEGWTSPENKKDRPIAPKTVGIVTSRQAAALRDIVRTIRRRNSSVRIIIAHRSSGRWSCEPNRRSTRTHR